MEIQIIGYKIKCHHYPILCNFKIYMNNYFNIKIVFSPYDALPAFRKLNS